MAKARRPCEFELQWFVFGPDGKTAVGQKVVAALWDGTEEQQEVESLNLYDVVSVDGVAARRATFMRPDGSVTPYPNWRAKRCCCGGEADTHGRCYDCGGYNSDADASGFMGAFFCLMSRRTEHGVARDGEPKRMPAKGRTCGQSNGPEWCTNPVFARGLCRKHYRRAAKGFPVDPDDGKRVGVTPSGFGMWGVVDEQDGRLLCHECGGWFRSLGVHIGMRHGSVRDYRMKHGLLLSQSLNAPDVRQRLADAASRPESLRRIGEARDPVRAGRKVDAEIVNRGRRLRRQSPGGR